MSTKKIFLDIGANDGCSVEMFKRVHTDDWGEFEIYCIEPNPVHRESLLKYTPNVITKLAWIHDAGETFDGWKMSIFGGGNSQFVQSIDVSKFISELIDSNAETGTYIVMKIDAEGAEYDIIDKMYTDGTLNNINELYGELHGPKCNKTREDDEKLMNQLDSCGLKMYLWDALETDALNGDYYTMEFLESTIYPVWRKRGYKI